MSSILHGFLSSQFAADNAWFGYVALLCALVLAGAWRLRRGGELRDFGKDATLPLRGLLALFVVVGHLDNDTGHVFMALRIFHWSTPAVAVFFFLSGYGLWKAYIARTADGTLGAYLRSFPRRTVARLLPPFLVLGPVYAIWMLSVGEITPGDFALRLATLRILDIPHDWYVIAIAFLYAFFWASASLSGVRRRAAIASIGALSLAFWVAVSLIFGDGSRRVWHLTCLSFPLGVVFAEFEGRIRAAFKARPFAVAFASVAAVAVALQIYRMKGVPVIARFREPLLCSLGPMAALAFMSFVDLRRAWPLCALGAWSYEIYLVHGVFEKMSLHAGLSGAAHVAAVFAATIPAAWALSKFDARLGRLGQGGRAGATGAPFPPPSA